MDEGILYENTYKDYEFTFIGITHKFEKKDINWNYAEYGKLWNYNLTYFDYLQQIEISKEEGLELIYSFIDYTEPIRGKKMPFPISLRNINCIKFLTRLKIRDKKVDAFIFAQYQVLMDNIEYHILGNHLLENSFSLLFGAYYFQDESLYGKAFEILTEELTEQILNDGAHFELSPMYHQIMLFRMLDCINLVKNNNWKNQELLMLLTTKAALMLGWLETITYCNGEIPLLNDSANGIAPKTSELLVYAKNLNIVSSKIVLDECGYRKISNDRYEMVIDVGNIGPDYIPGHAHSDTFNFELYVDNKPFIVDTGLSTYETNERRMYERSTSAHNTVEINGKNQTEVWGGFRVARRAKIISLNEKNNGIKAMHDGYMKIGCTHEREWKFLDSKITISDTIESKKPYKAISYIHFHPDIDIKIKDNIVISKYGEITFENEVILSLTKYNYAYQFNSYKSADVLMVEFKENILMEIKL